MNKSKLVITIVFLIAVLVTGLVGNSIADGGSSTTFKLFDDGIQYKMTESWGYRNVYIIHEGNEIQCDLEDVDAHSTILNPQCIEIIMRSLP